MLLVCDMIQPTACVCIFVVVVVIIIFVTIFVVHYHAMYVLYDRTVCCVFVISHAVLPVCVFFFVIIIVRSSREREARSTLLELGWIQGVAMVP